MSKVSKIESIVRNWQDQWSSSPRAESAGLLLADDAPQWDGGRLFGGSSGFFFTETSVTRKQNFGPNIGIFGPFDPMPDQKRMRIRWFSVMWVPKLLLPPVKISIFCPQTAKFCPKYAFLGTYRPCWFIWCPVGWLVGGCGARAVFRKTLLYYHWSWKMFL